jgi:hypothetical protein
MTDEYEVALVTAVTADASQLYKGDVAVNYAKAFIAIDAMIANQLYADAIGTADAMVGWLEQAAEALDDEEIAEMAEVMSDYENVLSQIYG